MYHALRYHGGFERNFPTLKPGSVNFIGTDGSEHPLPAWPAGVDGVRFGYMEKSGKKFAAVCVQDAKNDIVLQHEVLIDPARHMRLGQRFGPEPTIIDDASAIELLADIVKKNPDLRNELAAVRGKIPKPKAKG
jgi:hypothetical protein